MASTWQPIRTFFPYHPWHGNLWFDLMALVVVFALWDRDRWISWRNADLTTLLLWSALGDHQLGPLAATTLLAWLPLPYLAGRLTFLGFSSLEPGAAAGLKTRTMERVAVAALLYSSALVLLAPWPFGTSGDPAWGLSRTGQAGVLAARDVLDGHLPYGHTRASPSGRPVAVPYGPGHVAAFLPATLAWPSPDPSADRALAVRVTTLLLILAGFAAAHALGAALAGRDGSARATLVWSVLPFVPAASYWGWVGHLLTGVLILWILALAARRMWLCAGAVLGFATAATLQPLAYLPFLWLAARDDAARRRLLRGTLLVTALLSVPIVLASGGPSRFIAELTADERAALTSPGRRDLSPWSHWSVLGRARPALRWAVVPFMLGLGAAALKQMPRTVTSAGLCGGAVMVVAQAAQTHAPGRHVLWLIPALLLVFIPPTPPAEGGDHPWL